MSRALIGHSGFVGGNLRRQAGFDLLFNSANFRDMAGGDFALVVCAGLPAAKWLANKHPAKDRANMMALAARPSAMLPRNWHRLDAGQVAIFLDRFRIRFAYVVDRGRTAGLDRAARLVPIPGCAAPVAGIEVS